MERSEGHGCGVVTLSIEAYRQITSLHQSRTFAWTVDDCRPIDLQYRDFGYKN